MATTPNSVLTPPPQPLGLAGIVSVGLHIVGVAVFAGWTLLCGASAPVSDLMDRSVAIDFVSIKQADGMPQLAMRLPEPQGTIQPEPMPAAAPEPQPPAPEPPPVRESDLVRHVPEPAPVAPAPVRPAPPAPPDRSEDRERALAEARRQALLDAARVGAREQEATDPNGNASENIAGSGIGNPADPRLARWKAQTQQVFQDAFNPLQTDPALRAAVYVFIDVNTGEVKSSELARGSGNASFDSAAVRAAASITQIEPPPEEFRSLVGSRLTITFVPE